MFLFAKPPPFTPIKKNTSSNIACNSSILQFLFDLRDSLFRVLELCFHNLFEDRGQEMLLLLQVLKVDLVGDEDKFDVKLELEF